MMNGTTPLSSEMDSKIDAYWRAANYLSVGQIYLRDNPLLTVDQRRRISAACVSVAWKAARQSNLRVNRFAVLMSYLGTKLGRAEASPQMLDNLASAFRQIDGIRRPPQ